MNRTCIAVIFLLLLNTSFFAITKKTVEPIKINAPLNIDGVLDEAVYKIAKPATDFVEIQPRNGKPSPLASEVYFFYDASAFYVGAMLYDNSPDSIFNYLTERDQIGMSDYFGVYFDPYNQGQLAFGFFVTPSGVQTDIKAIRSDTDSEVGSWNAVWESKTKITDKGWVVEMRIPLSEMRFPDGNNQTWGLNMFRNIRRYNSNNSWSFIDRNVSGFIHQEGELTPINNLKPPVRLSLTPYLATYLESNKGQKPNFLYKGGLDLKYGINESFTLDLMLIPDFGQIQSDDKQLNLSPFELFYSEKRQFFNEGTELFNRADIFYSRRIGSSPKFSAYDDLKANERVDYNPIETQLVNATKVSGRTKNGLGLGILNAMSLTAYANVTDTISGKDRKVVVQPFTNFNVSVIDKLLKNNSYVSIINTNVSMIANPFRANVTATEFNLNNNKKTFALKGKAAVSLRGDTALNAGFLGNLGIERTQGKFLYGITQNIISDTYNPNDLGYLRRNNIQTTDAFFFYHITQPFSIFRDLNVSIFNDYDRIYNPNVFAENKTGFNARFTFTNNYGLGIRGVYNSKEYNYFEARVPGRFYIQEPFFFANINAHSDRRKNLDFELYGRYGKQKGTDQYLYEFGTETTLSLGQNIEIEYENSLDYWINERGFVTKNNDNTVIIFARRDIKSLQNIISTSYILNNKSSLSLRARHYWSGAINKEFFTLQNDGYLLNNPSFNENKNQNFNSFTVDMMYKWIFAPGSEMVISWKNDGFMSDNNVQYNYWKNLKSSWLNQYNTLSVKVLYYINYNSLKSKIKLI